MEKTLSIIKPDGVSRGLVGEAFSMDFCKVALTYLLGATLVKRAGFPHELALARIHFCETQPKLA